jgi:hypothetical protein
VHAALFVPLTTLGLSQQESEVGQPITICSGSDSLLSNEWSVQLSARYIAVSVRLCSQEGLGVGSPRLGPGLEALCGLFYGLRIAIKEVQFGTTHSA